MLYKEDAADSTKPLYRPSLKSTGYNTQTDKPSLTAALDELVELGWLYPPDRVGDMDSYRLSDRARENEIFVYNVEELARRAL